MALLSLDECERLLVAHYVGRLAVVIDGHPRIYPMNYRYRDGVLVDVALAWWREARIHAVDAVVGLGFDTWDDAFCAHLHDFLAVRLPEADGAGVELSGEPRAVAAWLAGRTDGEGVVARRSGAPEGLPELAPWPSAAPPAR
jgi:maleylpyruvate isomerase